MVMEKEFVPYEEALALKDLGFEEPCFGCYSEQKELIIRVADYRSFSSNTSEDTIIRDFNGYKNGTVSAPTFSQAFRWFREEYRLDSKPEYFLNDWYCFIINDMKGTETSRRLFTEYPSYEEAELECLKKLIEIVKDGNI